MDAMKNVSPSSFEPVVCLHATYVLQEQEPVFHSAA
jgi:hypothetical protein